MNIDNLDLNFLVEHISEAYAPEVRYVEPRSAIAIANRTTVDPNTVINQDSTDTIPPLPYGIFPPTWGYPTWNGSYWEFPNNPLWIIPFQDENGDWQYVDQNNNPITMPGEGGLYLDPGEDGIVDILDILGQVEDILRWLRGNYGEWEYDPDSGMFYRNTPGNHYQVPIEDILEILQNPEDQWWYEYERPGEYDGWEAEPYKDPPTPSTSPLRYIPNRWVEDENEPGGGYWEMSPGAYDDREDILQWIMR